MPQIFHPSTNTIAKMSIVGVLLGIPAISVAAYAFNLSYGINLNVPLEQAIRVPFTVRGTNTIRKMVAKWP